MRPHKPMGFLNEWVPFLVMMVSAAALLGIFIWGLFQIVIFLVGLL